MLTTTFAAPPPIPPSPYSPFENDLLAWGGYIFIAAAVLELAFLVHYVVVAPAFRSAIGWMFVLRSGSFLVAGVAIVLGRVLGPYYAARPYVTLVLFVVVLVSAFVTYCTFLWERYGHGPGGARFRTFTRRALGLRAEKPRPCDAAEPRPDTRPLRIVRGTGS